VRVKLKTIGIVAVTYNRCTTSRTALSWQSDLFLVLHHATRPNLWLAAQWLQPICCRQNITG